MNSYHIQNTISGSDLGIYQGDTRMQALDAMARDAGYDDYADLEKQVPAYDREIAVDLVTMFTINTECGSRQIMAESVEDAKAIYTKEHDFDFDAVPDIAGSWYWIEDENGERIEQDTTDMP